MATIQGVYVALFGRPADPSGLAYFNSVTKSGADLSGIGDLASTQEYKDRFAGQSNLAIVNSIYQSLFNRDAETAGLNFFVDALNKGTLSIKNIAIAILDGAQGTDKTIVTNKITAADNFTKALDTPVEIAAYSGNNAAAAGRAFLQPVNASISSIPTSAATDAAIIALASTATGGVSLSLTDASASVVNTTATDAKLKTTGGDDTITITDDYKAASKVDGGFGVDTLILKNVTTGATPAADAIVNVEKLFATAAAGATLNLTNVSGLKEVWNDNSGANALKVSNIADGVTLGVRKAADVVEFGFKAAQSGTVNIALDTATVKTSLTVTNGADNVQISTTGGSSVASYVDASAKTIKIVGSGDLTFATAAGSTKVATIDASALTGKLNLDVSAGANEGFKITGTNNVDTIKLAAAGKADTIVYNKAETSTFTSVEKITNFAVVEDKIDLKAFGLTKTGVTTFDNVLENASFGSSSVAIGLSGGVEYAFVDSNGDGKLNLATDFAIQLVGHNTNDLTAANFILS